MYYLGSKKRLLGFILESVKQVVGNDLSDKVFCDLFAGTGIVGQTFKPLVKKVIANDWEYCSFVLLKHYIENGQQINDTAYYIDTLNKIPLKTDGFIYQNYCLGSGSKRNYFSDINGKRIDVARQQIAYWKQNKIISDRMYYFLLVSLLESADRVANTTCVYSAFLKHLKKTAQEKLVIKPVPIEITSKLHQIYQKEAQELIMQISGDILYLDPPYNNLQYGSRYHLLNTIAKYDQFIPKGITGKRPYQKSDFCSKVRATNSFETLIKNAKFKYIFFSYKSR